MLSTTLKSTTAVALCLSLTMPLPVVAGPRAAAKTADELRYAQADLAGLNTRDQKALRMLLAKKAEARTNPDLMLTKQERTDLRRLLRKYSTAQGNPGNRMSLEEQARLGAALGLNDDVLRGLYDDLGTDETQDGGTESDTPGDPSRSGTTAKADPAGGDGGQDTGNILSPEEKAQLRAERAEKRAARQARRDAREAEAADTAAASETGQVTGVTRQTITEDQARSAGEEFETPVGTNTAVQQSGDSRNDLAKNLGKIALLGLGALAVGQILKNGDKVVANTGDRVVVEREGDYYVLKDDDTLLRRPGNDVQTETFSDGSTRTRVTSTDGMTVETISAANGRVLRRTRIFPDGRRVLLFDDTQYFDSVDVSGLSATGRGGYDYNRSDEAALRAALQAANAGQPGRRYSLSQVRNIDAVRKLVPEITVDTINFATGSSVIRAQEAEELAALGRAMRQAIDSNPGELFLIEGHTDAVGTDSYNLALSDRRAESLALALVEYFRVPPENMVVQGYGEGDLRVDTPYAEPANRRAAVRRITPLLRMTQQ